jgi:hypothetical protein
MDQSTARMVHFGLRAILLVICLAFLMLPEYGWAQSIDAYLNSVVSRYRLAPVDAAALVDADTRVKLAFVYTALAKTRELHNHQMRGATKNRVYVSADGQHEAVLDEHGSMVTDCVNVASYNYFAADRQPLEHFMFDMLPWIEEGNCPSDPTSKAERVEAYLKDFRDGAMRTFNGGATSLPADIRFNDKSQPEAAALFLRALRNIPAREIAALYDRSSAADAFERFFGSFSRSFAAMFE